ncbi:MAG: topoisomerase DNA-binding C4 zinc finger domain-containing protein [Candidatus Sumerlaeia bacterium]
MNQETKCMKCDKPATHKITKIVKGQIYDVLLCDEHAQQFSPYIRKGSQANLVELLQQILKQQEQSPESEGPSCPTCGLNFSSYRKTLLLGCSDCYEAFGDLIKNDLRKIHGVTAHHAEMEESQPFVMDFPDAAAPVSEFEKMPLEEFEEAEGVSQSGVVYGGESKSRFFSLGDLNKELEKAISGEDFGRAAELRDTIKKLEAAKPKDKVNCGSCGAPMQVMQGPQGPVLGCSNYPTCKNIRRIPLPEE